MYCFFNINNSTDQNHLGRFKVGSWRLKSGLWRSNSILNLLITKHAFSPAIAQSLTSFVVLENFTSQFI
jgi:hypothetical protein